MNNSIRGYARYLCHLDNPEKAQYSQESVRSLCGADYSGTIGLVTDKYKAIGEMIDYCKEYNIYSYSDLLEYCRMERFDWFRVLCDNGTVVMKEYLKSRSWTNQANAPQGKGLCPCTPQGDYPLDPYSPLTPEGELLAAGQKPTPFGVSFAE